MNIANELRYRFMYASPVIKLLTVNVAIFLLAGLVDVISFVLKGNNSVSAHFLALPSGFPGLLRHPWTILSYQFCHERFFHFAFNMLMLYFIGTLFLDFFRKQDVWKVYILGGVIAGIFFLLCNTFIPVFRNNLLPLVGASGSVMALLFATTSYAPHVRLNLFGVLPVRLIWIAMAYLLIAMLSIPGANGGGHIAHLGGALFGWLFASYRKGSMHLRVFEPSSGHTVSGQQVKVEVNHSKPYSKVQKSSQVRSGAPTQEEIDAILDKISKSGYDRLSKEEKDILFKASQD